jgi:hypothetical protein
MLLSWHACGALGPPPGSSEAAAGVSARAGWYARGVAQRENTGRKQAEPAEGDLGIPVSGSQRLASGKFAAGSSGNPGGRPAGSRNRATLLAQELLDEDGEAIVKKAIEMAKSGEPIALRLCIERILPRRQNVIELVLPLIRQAEDVADGCAAVIEAAAAGRITLQEAKEFMSLLDAQRRAIETHDLAIRIQLLEGGVGLEPSKMGPR